MIALAVPACSATARSFLNTAGSLRGAGSRCAQWLSSQLASRTSRRAPPGASDPRSQWIRTSEQGAPAYCHHPTDRTRRTTDAAKVGAKRPTSPPHSAIPKPPPSLRALDRGSETAVSAGQR
jgi:hypothetical protein